MSWFFRKRKAVARVAFNMAPRRGPYGGGNQWLNQLSSSLKNSGYAVQFSLDEKVDCVVGTHAGLGGSLAFSYEDILRARARNPDLVCIQRINDNDVRKGTDAMDLLLQEANRAADHTVFVSEWLRDYHASRWFDSTKHHSGHSQRRGPLGLSPDRRVSMETRNPLRLVTHHWSDNRSKGFDFRRNRRGDSVRKRSKHRTLGNRSLAEGSEMAKGPDLSPLRGREIGQIASPVPRICNGVPARTGGHASRGRPSMRIAAYFSSGDRRNRRAWPALWGRGFRQDHLRNSRSLPRDLR